MSQQQDSQSNNVVHVDFGGHFQKKKSGLQAPSNPHTNSSTARNLKKRELFEQMFEAGTAMVVFDASSPQVKVPSHFATERELRLNFSHNFRLPDLEVDNEGIRATLKFAEGYCFCDIPWTVIFALQCEALDKSALWPEDLPKAPKNPGAKPSSNTLKLVKDDG